MRTWAVGRMVAVFGLLAAGRLGAGCVVNSSDDCNALGNCSASTGTTTTTTTSDSTTTTVPPACIDFKDGDVVSAECGVFVAPAVGSDATGDGSQAKPFATLGKALGAAATKPVYACAGALKESVVVTGDRVVIGGFACDSWAYTGAKPALAAAVDAIAITVDDGASLTMQDFAVASVAAKKEGGSSIAILVRAGASLDLLRVDVTAGDGALGAAGATPMDGPPEGAPGTGGGVGCASADSQIPGGDGGIGVCDGTSTNGGLGGPGTKVSGGDGSEGEPSGGTGVGGVGAKQAGTSCKVGGQGSDGGPGPEGAGAVTPGTLTNDGFSGASGDPGDPGTPGQGGGGGGGGKVCANGNAGPSGGGGGAGGCGGKGGGGGGAGGSSIAIAAHQPAAITLTGGSLTTGKGGVGGIGAMGQDGGFGGPLGPAGGPGACAGGQGGAGGPGGPGGGGAGGHSIGIVWFGGTAPTVSGTTSTHGGPGAGGMGGPGSDAAGAGASGLAQDTLELK